MDLGLIIGYWPSSGPPPDAAEQIATAERLGFKSVWMSEAYGSDCFTPLAWWGSATVRGAARHRHHADLGPHAGVHRHDRHHARPPHRRAVHPRPRRERPAGRRGLVLARSTPSRSPAPASTSTSSGRIVARDKPVEYVGEHYQMPLVGRHRPRQAAQVDRAPAAHRHPDLPRRRGPEERRPGGRDLRRLAADVLLAEGRRLLPRRAGRGLRPARAPAARPTTSRWPASCPTIVGDDVEACADLLRPTLALYIGGMGAKDRNFHRTCSPASATRTRATRSRRRTSPVARTRRPATSPPSMVEDVYLVGPEGEDPRRPRGLAGELRHHDARERPAVPPRGDRRARPGLRLRPSRSGTGSVV